MSRMRRSFAFSTGLSVMALAWATPCFAQTLTDLGLLPGGTWCFSSNLSDDGTVVAGGADIAGGSSRAWRWTQATGKVVVGVLPGMDHSDSWNISGNGQVIVGTSGDAAYDRAMRWSAATGMQAIGSLGNGNSSFAEAASYDGSAVVGFSYLPGGQSRVFRWTSATGIQPMSQLLPGTSHASGATISSDGGTIVGYCWNNAPALIYPIACAWDSAGQVSSLGVLAGSQESVPSATNANGSFVVGYCADGSGQNTRAFRWSAPTGMTELPALPGASAMVAAALTADGGTITGYGIINGTEQGCIWTSPTTVLTLDAYLQSRGVSTAGWTIRTADISANGLGFTGWGIHNGLNRSWHVLLSCAGGPSIATQPQTQTVSEGTPVSFSVVVSGSVTSYQWYKNAAIIAGATSPGFSIASATLADAGDYTCVVTGPCGSATSNIAHLAVQGNCTTPQIDSSPSDTTLSRGMSLEFAVEMVGSGPFTYQWRHDGQELTGEITHRLIIGAVVGADAGEYRCEIRNDCVMIVSDPAILTVCIADMDDGTGAGRPDGGVTIDDLLYYLVVFENGDVVADVDDGSFTGTPDGGVTIDDLLYFLVRFESGC